MVSYCYCVTEAFRLFHFGAQHSGALNMNFSNAARPFFATRFFTCISFKSMLPVAAVCAGVFGFVAGANADTNNFVLGWGNNGDGQSSPIPAAANSDVKAIAGGYYNTVALKNDGSLIAWGQNTYGQCLGTNASGNRITTTPTGSPCLLYTSDAADE